MSLAQRWQEIRTGFARPFWIANGTELFERLAYYGLQAVLAIYLHERLRFSEEQTGLLQAGLQAVAGSEQSRPAFF